MSESIPLILLICQLFVWFAGCVQTGMKNNNNNIELKSQRKFTEPYTKYDTI